MKTKPAASATPPAPPVADTPAATTETPIAERPRGGGSYVRQSDGTLKKKEA